jgi:hypothetical protein
MRVLMVDVHSEHPGSNSNILIVEHTETEQKHIPKSIK